MKYSVLGAGALGSVIGGLMARDGIDVELWEINQSHLDAIKANGLRLDLPNGTEHVSITACRPEEAEGADVTMLLTKTMQSAAALNSVKNKIDKDTAIISLQNGLGNAGRVAAQIAEDQVFYGCTMMPGRFLGSGHVACDHKSS